METLSDDIDENYDRFFAEAISCGCVWGLEGPEGWALCESEQYEDTTVMPFWSQPEFAEAHVQGEWADYKVIPVALEEFLEDWLPGMHQDVYLVGINLDEELEGMEVEPLDVLAEFDEELE